MNDCLNIIIGGDIVPTDTNVQNFCNGNMGDIVSADLMGVLQKADMRIFNLETPLCDELSPIVKEGPCFHAPTKCVNGFLELKPTLFTLANNHILDQGQKGLKSTIDVLEASKVMFTGVGKNLEDANKVLFLSKKGVTIGIYGCVEHEFTVATRKKMGANPFDPFDSISAIKEAKNKCDYLIVLYHGGKEYYEYPSPELQKRCHKMIEAGADIILCQHSHCVGTYEEYRDGYVLYGQGNFILDRYVKAYEEYFKTGLLVDIELSKEGKRVSLIPIIKDGNGVRKATEGESKKILDEIEKRKYEILDIDFVEDNYISYVNKIGYRYVFRISRFGYIISSIDNRLFNGKLLNMNGKKLMGKHHRLALLNCLQCEVHNEVIRTYLSIKNQ